MAIEVTQKNGWSYLPAPGRLDAFNFELTKTEIEQIAAQSQQIAIDVSGAHFVSIPMIKFLDSLAREMVRKGGRLALVGPTEKLKRQISIFASLDPLTVFTQDDWGKHGNA
jgi:anti-anti-sigma regulatory factor